MQLRTPTSLLLSPMFFLLSQQYVRLSPTPNSPTAKDKFIFPPPCPSVSDYGTWNNTNKARYEENDELAVLFDSSVPNTRLLYYCCKNLGSNFGQCLIRPDFNITLNGIDNATFAIPERNDDRDICYLHLDQPGRKTGIDTQEFVVIESTDEPTLHSQSGDTPIFAPETPDEQAEDGQAKV